MFAVFAWCMPITCIVKIAKTCCLQKRQFSSKNKTVKTLTAWNLSRHLVKGFGERCQQIDMIRAEYEVRGSRHPDQSHRFHVLIRQSHSIAIALFVCRGVRMSTSVSPSEATYEVVVNQEGQYSIWLSAKALPEGWTQAGKQGSKDTCLTFISEVWADMRPLSLRRQMESMQPH